MIIPFTKWLTKQIKITATLVESGLIAVAASFEPDFLFQSRQSLKTIDCSILEFAQALTIFKFSAHR